MDAVGNVYAYLLLASVSGVWAAVGRGGGTVVVGPAAPLLHSHVDSIVCSSDTFFARSESRLFTCSGISYTHICVSNFSIRLRAPLFYSLSWLHQSKFPSACAR